MGTSAKTIYAQWKAACTSTTHTYNEGTGKCEYPAIISTTYCSRNAWSSYSGTCTCFEIDGEGNATGRGFPYSISNGTNRNCSSVCSSAWGANHSGTGTLSPSYYCPSTSGTSLTNCNVSGTVAYARTTDTECPTNWNLDESKGTNGHDYTCPSGGTLSGTTCSYTP
jgi:hypothetical protein